LDTRNTGFKYEKIAAEFLKSNGYKIIMLNYYCSAGEIDIVAQDEEYLCFVEVKYRSDLSDGNPAEAVDMRKAARISRSALVYMNQYAVPTDTPCRFDVVSILDDEKELIKNAFDFVGRGY